MGFVEIHFHLLPGVDDGPASLEQSLELAAAAVADGTGTITVTPHVHEDHVTDPLELTDRVAELAEQLRRARIPLALHAGGELSHPMVSELGDAQLEAIAHGPRGSRWVLLEAPFAGIDDDFRLAADELRGRGFAVVVAHPERAAPTPVTSGAIEHELACGSVLQLNAWSVAGRYGPELRERAARLLRLVPGAVIASDAHGRDRQPALQLGLQALSALGDRDPRRRVQAIPQGLLDHGLPVLPARRAA
jgi:protein-tyrosine phosphatase